MDTSIEGLYCYRRKPRAWKHYSGMYSYITEVFYHDVFLDFIFEPVYQVGPNGEKYIAAMRKGELDEERLPIDVCAENWDWYPSLEEAAQFIYQREFSTQL